MSLKELIVQQLYDFFPKMQLGANQEGEDVGTDNTISYRLLTEGQAILSYMQTLFFEERLIEIQLDEGTRLFFATLWDHRPEPIEELVDEQVVLVEPEYEEGAYLKSMDHLVLSPLEPVAGNIKIRSSSKVLLRFYTGTTAVEMGTVFLRADAVNKTQVLLLDFPRVGRVIPNSRPFRAKIPEDFMLFAVIMLPKKSKEALRYQIVDFSAMGLSFEHDDLDQYFQNGDTITIDIFDDHEKKTLQVKGTVRHFAKVRTKGGNMNICGVQFDLESRALAGEIEQMFAKVQRIFLRSLSDRTVSQGIRLTLE